MAEPHVISALVRKRAELAGEKQALQKRLKTLQSHIATVDASLRLFGYQRAPERIPSTRPINRLFKRGQLSRLVYEAMGKGARTNAEIAEHVIEKMGWDASDEALFADIRKRVKDVTKPIAK